MRVRLSPNALWLIATLAVVGVWVWRSMGGALGPGVVQDDARQHVFWMQRLLDPSLLQGDLYADYFESQAPFGYVAIYRALLWFVDPIVASKLLPPVLGLLAATFTYLLVRQVDPSPRAAFLVAILNSWYVWQYDDLPTGSPRAFLLPLCAAMVWALVTARRVVAIGLVALAALIYPSAAALMVVLAGLALVRFCGWRPRLSGDRRDWLVFVVLAGLAFALLAPMAFGSSLYGPAVNGPAAREMPEFGPNGRNAIFTTDPYAYWISSYRSGFDLRVIDRLTKVPLFYLLAGLALLWPVVMMVGGKSTRARLGPSGIVAVHILAASMVLFFAAHLLLFRLYLPSRFVAWTVPLAFSIVAGAAVAVIVERIARRLTASKAAFETNVLTLVVAIGLALYSAAFDGNFVRDDIPNITAYLRTLPPDTLIAGVPLDTDSVPALTGRPVLVNREYALAYHEGFYRVVKQRTLDLIDAYYADSPGRIDEFARKYGVQIFLVDRQAFDLEAAADAWAGSFDPYTTLVLDRLRRGGRFALLDSARRCGVVFQRDVAVVPATCFQQAH
jgi:hypothetical protein